MRNSAGLLILGMVILTASPGCDSYQQLIKTNDQELIYAKAMDYYNKKRYDRAQPLFEELIQIYKGTRDIAELYYYYAYCSFGLGEYMISSFHFKQIATNYFNSQYAEESLYMSAYSYYKLSPDPSLDQSFTMQAIDALQLFVNTYPLSSRIEKCNLLVDELWRKLELKAFNSAMLYLNLGNYQSASISFRNFLNDFPDSMDAEEAQFLVLKSSYLLALNSVETKQRDRLLEAQNAYNQFSSKYPESKLKSDADRMMKAIEENLTNI